MLGGWHVLEPNTPFVDNWHIDCICDHYEACLRHFLGKPGGISKLIINIPPRCEKSLLAVFWFAYTWTYLPSTRWLCASYDEGLSIRDNLKARSLITSPWYVAHYGDRFRLTTDQNVKKRYENSRTGFRIATGIEGLGTGEGGDFIVVDDPNKVREAESDLVREGTNEWWFDTMSTRFNNPETFVRVIIQQRVHEQDVTGSVLAKNLGYDHLCIPMRYEDTAEARGRVTSIGWQDPRKVDGELMWPKRFDEKALAEVEAAMTVFAASGQLQQRPVPRKGAFFEEGWFAGKFVDYAPISARRVRYWDKAATEGGGANTAGVKMAMTETGLVYVEDCVAGQWGSYEREDQIKVTAELDGYDVEVYVEQEPGSGGKDSAQWTIRSLAGYIARQERSTGSKETRAEPFSSYCKAGNVYIVRGHWNIDYIKELCKFPRQTKKDRVDASSGCFNRITQVREIEVS